jgi:hypothetical protein
MIDLLLQHGADPKFANDDGKRPAAVREKGYEEIAVLLERGGFKVSEFQSFKVGLRGSVRGFKVLQPKTATRSSFETLKP